MAKLTSPVIASVMSHVTLSNGCHYWKVRIDQFTGTSNNGFVAIGVAKEFDDGRSIGKKERCDCVYTITWEGKKILHRILGNICDLLLKKTLNWKVGSFYLVYSNLREDVSTFNQRYRAKSKTPAVVARGQFFRKYFKFSLTIHPHSLNLASYGILDPIARGPSVQHQKPSMHRVLIFEQNP